MKTLIHKGNIELLRLEDLMMQNYIYMYIHIYIYVLYMYIYLYIYIYIYIQIFTYTDILFYLTNVQKKIYLILINKYESLTKEKHPLKKGKLPTRPKYYIPPPSSLYNQVGESSSFSTRILKNCRKGL